MIRLQTDFISLQETRGMLLMWEELAQFTALLRSITDECEVLLHGFIPVQYTVKVKDVP